MGRRANYSSVWIVDRKFWDGRTWVLRYTACSSPYCRKCRGDTSKPRHGPYWAVYEEVDGRTHLRHHRLDDPLPWGDTPPPSIQPSEADPASRLNVKRARRLAAEARKIAALVEAAEAAEAAGDAKRAGRLRAASARARTRADARGR